MGYQRQEQWNGSSVERVEVVFLRRPKEIHQQFFIDERYWIRGIWEG